jgi:ribose 1,5-bisphosphokinase PhnN
MHIIANISYNFFLNTIQKPKTARQLELPKAKEILAEAFRARHNEVDEMIRRRLEREGLVREGL